MAQKNFYDAVLVGLDLPTLLAGALLSKRGFRVLVVGQARPWPSYDVRGARFLRAPFALTGYDSPVLARVFSELALRPLLQRRTRPLTPSFQVVQPRHRIDFGRDERALGRELEREYPLARRFAEELWQATRENGGQLDGLLKHDLMWPPEGFFERREFTHASAGTPFASAPNGQADDFVQPSFVQHREAEGARALASILEQAIDSVDHGNESEAFSPRRLRVLAALLSAGELDEGGLSGLYELLIESIRTHNGTLRLAERVDALTIKRGALSSLRLFPSDDEIGCQFMLWGLPVARLASLLADRSELNPLFEEVGEPRADFARFTLNLLVRESALPEGMAPRVLLLGDERLWVESARCADGTRAVITAEAHVPLRELSDLRSRAEEPPASTRGSLLADQRERMLSALRELSPFLREHLELIDSPHDGRPIEDVRAGTTFFPADTARRGPDTMETMYAFPSTRIQGAAALTVRTPIKRLLLCNGQVVPGLGLEGVFLTAWSAARAVTRSLNRAWMNRGRWTKVEL